MVIMRRAHRLHLRAGREDGRRGYAGRPVTGRDEGVASVQLHPAGGAGATPCVMFTTVPGATWVPAAGRWLSTQFRSSQSTLGLSLPRTRPAACSSPAASESGWSNRLG